MIHPVHPARIRSDCSAKLIIVRNPKIRKLKIQPGLDGFYLDCGFSGTGFKIAPAVGLCMAELIVDGAAKTVDISTLTPHRFAEGKLISGAYKNIWH